MHNEQGSSSAGDAGGPVSRKVSYVDRRLDAGQTGGSTCEGPGGQHGCAGFAHRRAVWAPFDERTHLHTRAGPRGKEPPLLLALRCLATSRRRARSSLGAGASSSPTGGGKTYPKRCVVRRSGMIGASSGRSGSLGDGSSFIDCGMTALVSSERVVVRDLDDDDTDIVRVRDP
jgi:hypothetical protein